MAIEVMKLIFAVLDVSFNSGHYTVIIKRQFCTLNFNNKISLVDIVGCQIIITVYFILQHKCWLAHRRFVS